MKSLQGKSFLQLTDFTYHEINYLLELSMQLKQAKKSGTEKQYLKDKNIILLFEKDSTRTRCAFDIASLDQGATVTYISPSSSQMGKKESMKDTARVLGRMYHGIEYRGFSDKALQNLADYSGVPVWNGLTEKAHPTQALADILTIREHTSKPFREIKVCYIGNACNNVCNSLMIGCLKMGIDFRIATPEDLRPQPQIVDIAQQCASTHSGKLTISTDIPKSVAGCDFIYTDVWLSMGEDNSLWAERIKLLEAYRVTMDVIKMTGNPNVKFMHCLPSFHNTDTLMGATIEKQFGIKEMEVTDEVFESSHSIVFDQAENRMHTIKAVMVATLGNDQ